MNHFAFGRIFGLLIAAVGIGASIWWARAAVRRNAEFHQWREARPLETSIDLSRPGETTAPFQQTCSTSHGESIFLDSDLDDAPGQNLEALFADLSGSIVIRDSNGDEIESVEINSRTVHDWDGRIMLAGFTPFRKWDYVATIRVDSGAAALAGKQQTIYARYQLCGLEQMPALIAGAFAFGAGIIGLVSAGCVLPGLLRSGFRRNALTTQTNAVNRSGEFGPS
jgi:hypothetical protein